VAEGGREQEEQDEGEWVNYPRAGIYERPGNLG